MDIFGLEDPARLIYLLEKFTCAPLCKFRKRKHCTQLTIKNCATAVYLLYHIWIIQRKKMRVWHSTCLEIINDLNLTYVKVNYRQLAGELKFFFVMQELQLVSLEFYTIPIKIIRKAVPSVSVFYYRVLYWELNIQYKPAIANKVLHYQFL